jgi:hypothetical protein
MTLRVCESRDAVSVRKIAVLPLGLAKEFSLFITPTLRIA